MCKIVFMEWNEILELESRVEGHTCQVIIISYKGLTSHLTKLAIFNLK